jgi:hypothetical protein
VHGFQWYREVIFGKEAVSRVQHLDGAYGDINLDYYPVQVFRLPVLPDQKKKATAAELFQYFRTQLTEGTFTNPSICEFEGFNDEETTLWLSASPTGAIIHIDMYKLLVLPNPFGPPIPINTNPDDGSVVCSLHDGQRWIFSTIQVHQDGLHPVSGSREFGYWQPSGAATGTGSEAQTPSHIFYTRAADRISDWLTRNTASEAVFTGGHSLWLSLQDRLVKFINSNGGSANAPVPISKRHDWETIKKSHFAPTEKWHYP